MTLLVTPGTALQAFYQGRTYGFAKIRVHETARTTAGISGLLRIKNNANSLEQSVSFFSLNAANTTEVTGTASYITNVTAIAGGGVRTVKILPEGSAKAVFQIDAVTGTLTLLAEWSNDGTTWTTLPVYPSGGIGGAAVTSIAFTGTTAQPTFGLYEADVSAYK